MSVNTELYELLEVTHTASEQEIRKAYRKKALVHHPDKGGDAEAFKKINFAYEVLCDEQKRKIYDQTGHSGLDNENWAGRNVPNLGDIFQGLQGIFDMLGTGFPHGSTPSFPGFPSRGSHSSQGKRQTPEVAHKYSVSLEDLCQRKVIKLKFNRTIPCDCGLTSVCQQCNGTGEFIQKIGPIIFKNSCSLCNGKGNIYQSCSDCQQGKKISPKIFHINLTPEMYQGYRYCFPTEGNTDHDCTQGDFVVVIEIKPHAIFELNGIHLIFRPQISLKEALCGLEIKIPHPNGEEILFKQDKVLCPQDKFCVEGKGMISQGNLLIVPKITFPSSLTESQKSILLDVL